ncbi:UvrD-helicase domain-containing protein [Bradyrhizobium barranii subsp. barranii]|uniref:UvrD-helicase domain-containing protein n=1 Tax=Bradyrhizobium barranii subsp. barranii TaxID=2823807 RepID=A0A9X9YCU8_9BRAD|nr:UvrD-helicase domain-containing protein [Bradyrhizobium barranii]UEM17742.1 UvrD-helicase domain-containing protein [Bradyrhizobium barranii subsp. barranii]
MGQWIINRGRLTESKNIGSLGHGVSLSSRGSGRLVTRLDTPPSSHRHHPDSAIAPSLRLSLAFPQRSGLSAFEPKEEEWSKVYAAAQRLIERGAISSILKASYAGVLIDEYQDCTISQHSLVKVVSRYLPTCVFGDYLQSIFGFRHDPAVDWDVDVVSAFPRIEELAEPWRWKRVAQHGRCKIRQGTPDVVWPVDLSEAPSLLKAFSLIMQSSLRLKDWK